MAVFTQHHHVVKRHVWRGRTSVLKRRTARHTNRCHAARRYSPFVLNACLQYRNMKKGMVCTYNTGGRDRENRDEKWGRERGRRRLSRKCRYSKPFYVARHAMAKTPSNARAMPRKRYAADKIMSPRSKPVPPAFVHARCVVGRW